MSEKERYLISLYGYADFITRITFWKSQYGYSHDEAVSRLYSCVEFLQDRVWRKK